MSFTIFSFLMAILWFDAFVLLSSSVRKKTGVLLQYSLFPLLLLSAISLIRVVFPLELPYTTVFRSEKILPKLEFLWNYKLPFFHYQISVTLTLVFICSVVSIILLVRFFVGLYTSHIHMLTLYTEEDSRSQNILNQIIAQDSPGKDCTILIVPDISSPVITGLIHPVILMPEEALTLSDKQLKYILRHEWCHFTSKDLWTKLLIHILCCLMWWNPPVHLLKREFEQVLELACDQKVTARMSERDRIEYLETILEIIRQYQGKENHFLKEAVGVNFIGIDYAANTTQRFQMVYDYKKCIASWKTNLLLALLMALLFLFSYSFVPQPYFPVVYDPPEDIPAIYLTITPENSYIRLETDGTYSLFVNGQYFDALTKSELVSAPYNQLPITDK